MASPGRREPSTRRGRATCAWTSPAAAPSAPASPSCACSRDETLAAAGVVALALIAPATAAAADDPFVMTATSYAPPYAPAYVGNGYVGTRVPAQGMGYVAG